MHPVLLQQIMKKPASSDAPSPPENAIFDAQGDPIFDQAGQYILAAES